MSEFLYVEDVETFCPKTRCQVLVTLRAAEQPKGDMISGVPESCNSEGSCSKNPLCLLKASKITTTRRKSR
jgi:hypothetical protein